MRRDLGLKGTEIILESSWAYLFLQGQKIFLDWVPALLPRHGSYFIFLHNISLNHLRNSFCFPWKNRSGFLWMSFSGCFLISEVWALEFCFHFELSQALLVLTISVFTDFTDAILLKILCISYKSYLWSLHAPKSHPEFFSKQTTPQSGCVRLQRNSTLAILM